MSTTRDYLGKILRARANDQAWAWLQKAEGYARELDENRLLGAYTAVSRRLGRTALRLEEAEKAQLLRLDQDLQLDGWGIDELGRAWLLTGVAAQAEAGLLEEFYRQGDVREQQSWLRALNFLPEPERFLETAIDACRTNILPLFESIACENPYPYRHFPELNFNQMVLKALFNEVEIARIVGLEKRFNAEMSRMAGDYVSEREAAHRKVPPDIWLALTPYAGAAELEKVFQYAGHNDPNHRFWAARALAYAEGDGVRAVLEARSAVEQDRRVRSAIRQTLEDIKDSE